MRLFGRKKETAPLLPPGDWELVLRSSICTGERTACLRDRETGKLRELQLIRSEQELQKLCHDYGVSPEKLKTIY